MVYLYSTVLILLKNKKKRKAGFLLLSAIFTLS